MLIYLHRIIVYSYICTTITYTITTSSTTIIMVAKKHKVTQNNLAVKFIVRAKCAAGVQGDILAGFSTD